MRQAAGEKDLTDKLVELGQVPLDLRAPRRAGIALEELHRHPQTRQRRTQLVAGIGQERAVRGDQRLDLRGRTVEAGGDRGDLVPALDRDPE